MALPIFGVIGGAAATIGGATAGASSAISSNPIGSFIDGLLPKASDIFETRTATRIFDSHQDIALRNIEGGLTPSFTENENLYGFTIFQYKRGLLGGGWAPINVSSLLGFDLGRVSAGILGGDQIANVNSYFFNLHPRTISVSEPFATHLVPTQGGGVYAESQGAIFRSLSLSGTTGYRPSKVHAVSNNPDNSIPWELNEPTGYLNFLKLRNVFRNYSDLKRTKSEAYKTYMVWYNNKEQEAWFFEPTNFMTARDAASPFTYNYEISGTLIQKVNFSTVVSTISPDPASIHFLVSSMRRSAGMINNVLGLIPKVGDNALGDLFQVWNECLKLIDDVDNTVTNLVGAGFGAIGSGALLAGTVAVISRDFLTRVHTVKTKFSSLFGFNLSESEGINSYFTNIDKLTRTMVSDVNRILSPEKMAEYAGTRNTEGGAISSSSLFSTVARSKQSLLAPNSAIEYENNSSIRWVGMSLPATDIDLESWAYEITGDPTAFSAVVAYNNLTYPYISATPSYQQGLNKFLNAGDIVYLPFPKDIIRGDINTKINPLKVTSSFVEEALGRDLKLTKSTHGTTGVSEFNLTINATGDLGVIGGVDNMRQAIDIKLNTERGELELHPEFGIVSVIGNKGSMNLNFNLYLSLNDTMLSDGRITELTNTSVKMEGDIIRVNTQVNIINKLPYIPLSFSMAK